MVHFKMMTNGLVLTEKIDVFHIEVTLSNLRHYQFCIEDTFLIFMGENLFANIQTILPTCFAFSKHSSFSHNVNYAKKLERQSNVKCWWLLFKLSFALF